MSTTELRRYHIKPGQMDEFLEEWRPAGELREAHGFKVLFAFADDEVSEFTWAFRYDGDDLEEAKQRFSDDAKRQSLLALDRFVEDHRNAVVRVVL